MFVILIVNRSWFLNQYENDGREFCCNFPTNPNCPLVLEHYNRKYLWYIYFLAGFSSSYVTFTLIFSFSSRFFTFCFVLFQVRRPKVLAMLFRHHFLLHLAGAPRRDFEWFWWPTFHGIQVFGESPFFRNLFPDCLELKKWNLPHPWTHGMCFCQLNSLWLQLNPPRIPGRNVGFLCHWDWGPISILYVVEPSCFLTYPRHCKSGLVIYEGKPY